MCLGYQEGKWVGSLYLCLTVLPRPRLFLPWSTLVALLFHFSCPSHGRLERPACPRQHAPNEKERKKKMLTQGEHTRGYPPCFLSFLIVRVPTSTFPHNSNSLLVILLLHSFFHPAPLCLFFASFWLTVVPFAFPFPEKDGGYNIKQHPKHKVDAGAGQPARSELYKQPA